MPKHIWSKLKLKHPRCSKDTISSPAVIESSSGQTIEDETVSVEPNIRVFYADGPYAGFNVTTVPFSRDLSKSGVTSFPVFITRNLDIPLKDKGPSQRLDEKLRLSVDPYATCSGNGIGSTNKPSSQDFSEPRITLSSMLGNNGQDSERSKVPGSTSYQDSGSCQFAHNRVGAPQRKGTPPLLFGTRQMRSADGNLGHLANAETTAPVSSFSVTKPMPIAIRLPRFDTQDMDTEVRLLKKQLRKINTDDARPSVLHAKKDKILFEALCDKMPVAIYEPHLNLIDDLLLPARPKPVAIFPKRLSVFSN